MIVNQFDKMYKLVKKDNFKCHTNKAKDIQFITINVDKNTKYFQFLISKFTEIKFIGFIDTKINPEHFNIDFYNNMFQLIHDEQYNLKVMSNLLKIDPQFVLKNNFPFTTISMQPQDVLDKQFEYDISSITQLQFDNPQFVQSIDQKFKIVLDNDDLMKIDTSEENLFIKLGRYNAKADQYKSLKYFTNEGITKNESKELLNK